MPLLDAGTLERVTRDIFARLGAPADDAAWIAMLLVRANLRGHDSHGVIRIPQYVAAVTKGERRGIALAIDKARAQGLAAVTLRRTNHVGRLADYAELAAAAGLIGMLWVNAKGGLNVAPWGGAARRLGTNPHAIAIPGPGGTVAMSHDFATSVWAEGKLRVKFNRGEAAPPGVMLNGRGEPSTDPKEYYTEPPGSLLTAGGHKGYGLSLAVEILAGILSGTGAASAARGPFANGTLMLCLDPGRFLAPGDFHAQVADLLGYARSAPLAAGAKEILVPGEPEARTERERRARGVPLDDETWRQIRACAVEAGVDA